MITLVKELNVPLEVMAYLSGQPDDVSQPSHTIARQCRCSEGALLPLLRCFTEAGFLKVRRGRRGGFRLMRSLEQITLHELIEALNTQLKDLTDAYPYHHGFGERHRCHA